MSRSASLRLSADAKRRGAAKERARIAKAQAAAIRNLRVLYAPECNCEAGLWRGRRHLADCPRRDFDEQLRWLRDATREPKR